MVEAITLQAMGENTQEVIQDHLIKEAITSILTVIGIMVLIK
jgi:ABC-type methionine transport system permease subunit